MRLPCIRKFIPMELYFGFECLSFYPLLEIIPRIESWITHFRASGYDLGLNIGLLLGGFLVIYAGDPLGVSLVFGGRDMDGT